MNPLNRNLRNPLNRLNPWNLPGRYRRYHGGSVMKRNSFK